MSLAPLNCPKIPFCITHLVVFCSPSAVPINFEKLGRCPCLSISSCRAPACLGQKMRTCLAICRPLPQLQGGEGIEGTLAWKRKASRPFVPVLSWMASELSTFLSPLWSFRASFPGGASTKSGLGGLLAEDCHCCSQRALILQFAHVEIAAGHLRTSSGTHCQAQESWEATRGAGSEAVGMGW